MVLLAPLIALAEVLVAFAIDLLCLALVAYILYGLITFVNKIPGVNVGTDWIKKVEQSITHAIGSLVSSSEAVVGSAFSGFALVSEKLWVELKAHGHLVERVAAALFPIAVAAHVAKALAHGLEKRWHGIEHGVKTLTREFHGIERLVKRLERDLTKGIGHDLRLQVKALRKDLAHVEHKVIPSLREEEAQAAASIDNLYEWAKGKASIIGIGTFATAVAAAIGIDVFNWLRCNSASNLAKKYKCGFWKWIEDALALIATIALAVFSVLKPQDLAEAAVAAVDEIEPILAAILKN